MTEFITRVCHGESRYEVIIKTDNEEHYKAAEKFARSLIDHEKPQTNADRIRAMSDEELAEFLFGFECAKEKFGTQWDCQGEALKWLREPADQDDDEDERLPRIGRWVLLDVGVYAGSVCSVCQDQMSCFLGQTTRYCPNCGARMIGGGDNA